MTEETISQSAKRGTVRDVSESANYSFETMLFDEVSWWLMVSHVLGTLIPAEPNDRMSG